MSWRRVCAASAIVCSLSATAAAQGRHIEPDEEDGIEQLVAVSILGDGRAILLATPGLPRHGRSWRFRSLDTRDLPQPIRRVSLSSGGTKLFIQTAEGPGGVLDLTREYRHHVPLQYVSAADLAVDGRGASSHRVPAQRFVSIHDGQAFIVDDTGRVVPEYPAMIAANAAVSADGATLYLQADGTLSLCGEDAANRAACRTLPGRIVPERAELVASALPAGAQGSSPRFAVVIADDGHASVVNPEATSGASMPAAGRTEASLRACLTLHGLAMKEEEIRRAVSTLVEESGRTWARQAETPSEWTFFHLAVDRDLYAPVLEFSRLETVFPGPFETIETLAAGVSPRPGRAFTEILYDRYLRLGAADHRAQCTYYVTTHSAPGSWFVEYWLYYPFDVGGLGSHPHDPEHIFIEVDKLGGTVHRVIGAGHGYMAGNNMFTAGRGGSPPIRLPLFAIAELGKHASAPDIDRDGVFTPGIDENEYNERAKVWGVRDVIGTIDNELIAYDKTMSGSRRPEEYLALATASERFPDEPDLRPVASCGLRDLPRVAAQDRRIRLSDVILLAPCGKPTTDCAKLHVTAHPDFLDVRTVLKEWNFPSSFLRAVYGLGPRRGLHSVGVGYAMDMDRIPGLKHAVPLPGRLGVDAFYWHQPRNLDPSTSDTAVSEDRDSCPRKAVLGGAVTCPAGQGFGWGIRYEQFLSNLFGIFSAVRSFSPPIGDAWITFGPFVEAPIGRRSNVMMQGGLAFRPYASPRFELRVSVGLWKPKTNHVGIAAGIDDGR